MKARLKKLVVFALAMLLPAVAYAAVTGLPSRPKFQIVTINTPTTTPATTTGLAVTGPTNSAAAIAVSSHPSFFTNATVRLNAGSTGVAGRRIAIRKNADAETGSNAGSNFQLETFDDSGAHLGYPITVTRSNSLVIFEASVTSSKACAAGYSRLTPNYCRSTTDLSYTTLTRDSCTTIASPASDATALMIHATSEAISNNAVQQISTYVASYPTNGCATLHRLISEAYAYEHVAVAGGVNLARGHGYVAVPVDGSGNIYLRMTDDATNTSIGRYEIVGYFD